MDNAIKFSKAGDSINVEVKADKKETHITVSDTGEGIEAQSKEKIFAPFSRATDTQQLNYEGLGLSLYTDKIITDKYNGTIAVSENPGGGTIVRVALQSRVEQ
jgi:K+-sensing histidine kinase KdpD